MKKRLILFMCSLILTLFETSFVNSKSTYASINETPVLLKVNDYYVLYTTPKSPYIDSHNRFMIPLRSISELLGAQVEYNSKSKIAIIKMDSKMVTFQINSKTVTVDGKKYTMDTVPVLYENSMFIPLGVLINNLGIQNQWDQANKLYKLTGKHVMQTEMIKNIEDLDRQVASIKNNNGFMPKSYRYNPDKNTMMINSKNITGTDLPKGKEDVYPYFIFDNSYQFDHVNRERSAVKKDEIVKTTWLINPSIINNKLENLRYVLVKGRILN